MLNLFLPNKQVPSIEQLTPEKLKREGILGVVVDLDNTLVPWNVADATKDVRNWLYSFLDAQLHITIFSNNDEERVKRFAAPLDIPYVARAKKPLGNSFKKAASMMNVSPGQLAVIGDQLLTDILGGNRFGAYTILVDPLVESDAPVTQMNRRIEAIILNYFYRTNKLRRRSR